MGFDFFVFVGLVLGIVLVTRNLMISNIRKIAVYLRWDNKMVGQLLGYATSTPEFLNAFVAASIGMIDASIYNIISSNIFNVVFVSIATLMYGKGKAILNKRFIEDYIMIILSVLLPAIFIEFGVADKLYVIPILAIFYIIFFIMTKKRDYYKEEEEELEEEKNKILKIEKKEKVKIRKLSKVRKQRLSVFWILLFLSFIILYVLGNLLSATLEILGNTFNVNQIILGIVIGLSTSLPEFLSFMSSYKRHKRCKILNKDKGAMEVVSNLVTSNISNLCIIQTFAIIVYYLCRL